jgi:hypothetical protein
MKKFSEIKTKKELRERVSHGVLSVGCYLICVRGLLSKEKTRGSKEVKVIYSPGYGGTAEMKRYL